jgi:hypothetical protein
MNVFYFADAYSMRTLYFLILCTILFSAFTSVNATEIDFEGQAIGKISDGWISGVTGKGWVTDLFGRGDSRWTVERDASAPSPDQILEQSAEGKFLWSVVKDSSVANGYVQTKFKAISGKEDQAAGLIWRWKNGDNYYITRANALENNISMYYMEDGSRHTLKYVDASKDNPVTANIWHTLRIEFQEEKFEVLFNGEKIMEIKDEHIRGKGAVGLWTKADSVIRFDDFSYDTQ